VSAHAKTGLDSSIGDLAFSPDGASLAAALGDGTIALLDPVTGRERKRLATDGLGAHSLAFAPDGRTIVGGVRESLWFWDTATGKMVSRLEGHTASINSVNFGPNGRTFLSSGADSQVYFWSLK
jgi:WD40 repeat protein